MTLKKIYWGLMSKFITRPADVRIARLEDHVLNRRSRVVKTALEECADYLVWAEMTGDYLEFGVYQGTTFAYAYRMLATSFPNMRFFAFDSFEGLPPLIGIDAAEGSNFCERQFACSRQEFESNIRRNGVDTSRVRIIEGWFDDTLKPEKACTYGITSVAAAWIDADLYNSTAPVLTFITPLLQVGSVLLFDDWRSFRNQPDLGVQKACREWMKANPQISLHELLAFGWHGMAFTVGSI